jgi:calcineurin-like phosphoesterase family protein
MNEALVRNWNAIVGIFDSVYFLGDLTFGPDHHLADYWLNKLNGRKFFIRGNHDTDLVTSATEVPNNYVIHYCGHSFLLAHKPIRPSSWSDWIIHGEKHDDIDYPFINRMKKTINVSVEATNYRPISMDDIVSEIDRGDEH